MPDPGARRTPSRVLHIITDLGIGGAERLVVSAARGLPRDRFESVICCLAGRGPLAAEAEAAGVTVHSVGAFPGVSNPGAFARLTRQIRSIRPTIVHTHLQSPNLYGRLAARLVGVPILVATEHNVYETKAGRYIAAERVLARITDALVAVSAEVQQYLSRQIRVPAARIHVIRNGVAAPLTSADGIEHVLRRIGSPTSVLRIATVASLTPKKGHQFLLRALARLRDRGCRAVALLAGEGSERSRLEALASELSLCDSVHFLGSVKNPADVVAAADIVVLPSLVEGLPLALLEGMRAGKAIVATAVGGVPEVVSSGINGLLVAPADDVALADAIEELSKAPERRVELGARARETAERDFTEAAYVNALAALYDTLLRR